MAKNNIITLYDVHRTMRDFWFDNEVWPDVLLMHPVDFLDMCVAIPTEFGVDAAGAGFYRVGGQTTWVLRVDMDGRNEQGTVGALRYAD